MTEEITVISRKFNGSIHRSWNCTLIDQKDSLLLLVGQFNEEVHHPHLGVIRRGTVSYEYFWNDKWFNIFRFHESIGDFRNFYCNITMPPKFQDRRIDYIDLDIDILVWGNFDIEILDLDEFMINAEKFRYSEELKTKVRDALYELINMIELRQFPFDFK